MTGHSKSISWHETSSLDPDTRTPVTRGRRVHRASVPFHSRVLSEYEHSTSPDKNQRGTVRDRDKDDFPPASPSKRPRTRSRINPATIGTPGQMPTRNTRPAHRTAASDDFGFQFPAVRHSWHVSDSAFNFDPLGPSDLPPISTSPTQTDPDATALQSPYIVTANPNWQEIFISLAIKERRVLEARDTLRNAETELALFKSRWSSVINFSDSSAPQSNPASPPLISSEGSSPKRPRRISKPIPCTLTTYRVGLHAYREPANVDAPVIDDLLLLDEDPGPALPPSPTIKWSEWLLDSLVTFLWGKRFKPPPSRPLDVPSVMEIVFSAFPST